MVVENFVVSFGDEEDVELKELKPMLVEKLYDPEAEAAPVQVKLRAPRCSYS